MDFFDSQCEKPRLTEEKRPLKFIGRPEAPAAAIWHLMSSHVKALERERKELHGVIRHLAPVLFDLRRLTFSEAGGPESDPGAADAERPLTVWWQGLENDLKQEGIVLESLDGRSWDDIEDREAEVLKYMEDSNRQKQVVIETVHPLVKYKGNILQPAKVIVSGPHLETL